MSKDNESKKVEEIVSNKGVKLHTFYPSGASFWTVVGRDGEYILFEKGKLCSCPATFFNILKGNDTLCIHLEAMLLAKERLSYDKITGHDSEISIFINLLTSQI